MEYPWPESPEVSQARIRSLVSSVLTAGELIDVRLEWVTPDGHRWDAPDAGWIALRLTVVAIDDEVFQSEVWNPELDTTWDFQLAQLASALEDWVCETSFGWGQQRHAW